MDKIIQKLKDIKEIVAAIIAVISLATSGWAYVTSKFALKEHVDYVYCMNDKQIKTIDSTMKLYALNEGLSALYEKEASFENKPKTKQAFKEYRELMDTIGQHKTEIATYEKIKKEQEGRDCLKEIGYEK